MSHKATSGKRKYRLACLVSHPIQYQAPLFRYIAQQPEVDLTVFFLSDCSVRGYEDHGFGTQVKWDISLLEGYNHIFLPCIGRSDRLSFWRPFTYTLGRHLRTGLFDALWIHGYAHQVCLRALFLAKRLGIKVLLRGESNLISHRRSRLKLQFKRAVLPWFFKMVDGFLAIGSLNQTYYEHYGVPKAQIFWMPYAVDNDFFRKKADEARIRREELRRELRLKQDRPVILFASKFQRRKRPGDLLEAYIHLSPDKTQEPWPYLVYVGDGEERLALEARVRKLSWTSIRFLGFKNQSELPRYYDLSDAFVLPSEYEPWGLVVNEVMNAGKPVIVSDQVGCGPDLVKDGRNGFIFPVGDIKTLSYRLHQLTVNRELAKTMGQESLKRIATWSFGEDLAGLLHALKNVLR